MPRYRASSSVIYDRPYFVRTLADELGKEASGPLQQPVIFEQAIPQTDTFHVVVFWDEWAQVPPEERGAVILDAYSELDRDLANKITIAMGVTTQEAIELNLLPYSVSPIVRKNEIDKDVVRKAMRDEGAIETESGPQLRFPSEELAKAAQERLSKRLPAGQWTVIKTESLD